MERVEIRTVYEHVERLKPQRIALIAQRATPRWKKEEGTDEVFFRDLRNREEIFKTKLLNLGIKYVPFVDVELESAVKEVRKRKGFDMCVVTGDPFYQLIPIAAALKQRGRFSGPILIEITEEEAARATSLRAGEANAKQRHVENLLFNLVYLTKKRGFPRDIELDLGEDKGVVEMPTDIAAPPGRFESRILRIIRDTKAARILKRLYDFQCQICGTSIAVSDSVFYVEAHHVRPLGGDHGGSDDSSNMLVLCPNHHAMFDLRIPRFLTEDSVQICRRKYHLKMKHKLAADAMTYHNSLCSNFVSPVVSPGHEKRDDS